MKCIDGLDGEMDVRYEVGDSSYISSEDESQKDDESFDGNFDHSEKEFVTLHSNRMEVYTDGRDYTQKPGKRKKFPKFCFFHIL